MLGSITPVAGSLTVFYLVGVLLMIYVIHDVLMEQDGMEPMEQLFWIGAAVLLNLVGAAVYLAVVQYGDGPIIDAVEDGPEDGDGDDGSVSDGAEAGTDG